MATPTVTIEVGYLRGAQPGPSVGSLVVPANPDEQFTQDIRTTLIQTRIGAYYDKFGNGIATLQLSGTTAWESAQTRWNGQWVDGQAAARHLYRDIYLWYENRRRADQTPAGLYLQVLDDATQNAWIVEPLDQIQWSQTAQAPIQVYFTWNLSVIRDMVHGSPLPAPPDPLAHVIGHTASRTRHALHHLQRQDQQAQAQRRHPTQIRVVQSGETFWSIAQSVLGANATAAQVQTEVQAIEAANRALNPYALQPGMRVVIPVS